MVQIPVENAYKESWLIKVTNNAQWAGYSNPNLELFLHTTAEDSWSVHYLYMS